MSVIPQSNPPGGRAALGPSHGYRFEGDTAFLHAELYVPAAPDAAQPYALQLWACDAPHVGGTPRGIKVAEAPLPRSPEPPPRLEARTVAHLPPAQREYAMVLVLAAGDQVLDYANYAAPQRFVAPLLEGRVGYRIDGDSLELEAERVHNPRAADNLSGTLSLELWAHEGSYAGGEARGTRLGQVELTPLSGQSAHDAVVGRAQLTQPPPGTWHLTLMLREWTAAEGYRTRDFRQFETPYVVATQEGVTQEVVTQEVVTHEVATPSAPVANAAAPSAPAPRTPAPSVTPIALPPSATERALVAKREIAPSSVRVSLQRAPVEVLARVPGLNARLAAAIVRQRPFRSVDDLTKVRGIGDKLLRVLRPHLSL